MRILSGIQPSGAFHIGNYFGMMEPSIRLQDEGEAYYFIADYHALTTVQDGETLRQNCFEAALDFLACGLDPVKSIFFRHSAVPEVTELSWLLSTVTPMGLLQRCHSYKDKVDKGITPSHGLFAYPVLMAADILIYDSDIVPVGKDQKQHVEVTRDIAIKMNEIFGEGLLKLPKPQIRESMAKVTGLDGQKMSKSYGNTIDIFGAEKQLRKKIMKIKTDSVEVDHPKDPEASIIYELYQLFANESEVEAMANDFRNGGVGYGDFKKRLWEAYWEYFAPMRARREELLANRDHVDEVLKQGAERARELATGVLGRVRHAMGL
jgi:tryptophanyl-tRNA synthetase